MKPLIPAWLDDAGLSPAQFRVWCHIARRGECFAAVSTIAEHCQLHKDTVRRAIRDLLRLKLLQVDRRKGKTSLLKPLWFRGHHPSAKKGGDPYEKEGGKGYPIKGTGTKSRELSWRDVS